jgi:replicative DNA helicase
VAEAREKTTVAKRVEALNLPPQSLEAEQALLGAILVDGVSLPRVLETRLTDVDFYRETHSLIFKAMRDHFERGEPVDVITLAETLKRNGSLDKIGGYAYLSELSDAVATSANVEHYARIIRECSILRRLISTSGHISEKCYGAMGNVEGVLDEAEASIFAIREGKDTKSLQPAKALLRETISHIEANLARTGGVTGVPTGFKDLDDLTGGFQPSDLIILAGRPSMGKTALALNMAIQVSIPSERFDRTGEPYAVAFFSLEMSQEQVMQRLLCSVGDLDLKDIRTGTINRSDFIKVTEAASKLDEAPIYIDDTPALGVLELRAKARRFKSQLAATDVPMGLIIVDYLQLMRGTGSTDSREQEISEISRSLKALAKELEVPVVALSQLNRRVEERPNKRPMLADLRESGAIEQDADVIGFVYREEVYKQDNEELRGRAELIIGKQRNGPVGNVPLAFQHRSARFRTTSFREDVYY